MGELDSAYLNTVPVSRREPFATLAGPRVSLLIYQRDAVEVVPLVAGRAVVVGRTAPPADIGILEPSLSQRHARFWLDADGAPQVEDLGSTNGTFVAGRRVEAEEPLAAGQVVQLGDVAVCVHAVGAAEREPSSVGTHERFVERLGDEIVRHRTFRQTLGVIVVQHEDRAAALSGWSAAIASALRPVDHAAVYSRRALEIYVPHTSRDEIAALAEQLAAHDGQLCCGAALFPEAATDADELLALALSAAQRARPTDGARVVITEPKVARTAGDVVSPRLGGEAMAKAYAAVDRLAKATIPVLLVGETGVGKEVIARTIHQHGPRADKPMRSINCGAIPSELIESTLFGHERGAFTGADRRHKGLFEEADGGTLLLDEVGELAQPAQVALLRVLETRTINRVGSATQIPVDVRLIAATHRNLEEMCESGAFRWDLLYRLNTMTLKIPPLRQRTDEIAPLARLFIEQANDANGCAVRDISAEALAQLERYAWHGNVRELKNVIARCVVMADADVIDLDDLPERVLDMPASSSATAPRAADDGSRDDAHRETFDDGLPLESDLDFRTRVARFEQRLIEAALARTGGVRTEAAALIGISPRTLTYKLRAYGIK